MLKPNPWPVEHQQWDNYRAFHIGVGRSGFHRHGSYNPSPLVLFDTGELILIDRMPKPDKRGVYTGVGVELTRSDDMGGYWTPTGMEVKKAWFQAAGSQWALVDHKTGRAVRTDIVLQTRDHKIERPNIPARFQSCAAYIGGPGCHPIGTGPFIIRPTIRDMPQAMQDHVKVIEQTFRAAMMLSEHEITRDGPVQHNALSFERIMRVTHWDQLTADQMMQLWQKGVDRPKLTFDYLLTERPR